MSGVITWINLLAIAFAIYIGYKYTEEYFESFEIPMIFAGLALFFAVLHYLLAEQLPENDSTQNFRALIINGFVSLRNGLLATVGWVLIRKDTKNANGRSTWKLKKRILGVDLRFVLIWSSAYAAWTFILFGGIVKPVNQLRMPIDRIFDSISASLHAAVAEELFFRLFVIGILIRLAKRIKPRWIIAILISGIYWSLNHMSAFDPGWVKFIHVFPISIVLGTCLQRYGFETCVMLHILSNLAGFIVIAFI